MKQLIYFSLIFVCITLMFSACSNSKKMACPNFKTNDKQNFVVKQKKTKKKQHKESYATTHIKQEKPKETISFLAQKNKKERHKTATLESKPKKEVADNPTFANSDNDNLAATMIESEKSFLEKISMAKAKESNTQTRSNADKVAKSKKGFKPLKIFRTQDDKNLSINKKMSKNDDENNRHASTSGFFGFISVISTFLCFISISSNFAIFLLALAIFASIFAITKGIKGLKSDNKDMARIGIFLSVLSLFAPIFLIIFILASIKWG